MGILNAVKTFLTELVERKEPEPPKREAEKITYTIVVKDGKQAIFDNYGRQISPWADKIYRDGLINNKSDYYIAEKDGKMAIFHKDGRQISDWYDYIFSSGLVYGESEYYLAKKDNKVAIFNKDGIQISPWLDNTVSLNFLQGQSDYFEGMKDGKYAIFNKDGIRISGWHDKIYGGIYQGKSDYFEGIIKNKKAIFYKDGTQISEWLPITYYSIDFIGGKGDYFLVAKSVKYLPFGLLESDFLSKAIFDKDGNRITPWVDYILSEKIETNKSDFYEISIKDRDSGETIKRIIFNIDGVPVLSKERI